MEYIVTPAPHKYGRVSTNDQYVYISIALVMCFMYGMIPYGYSGIIILLACLGTCVLIELVISSIKNKRIMLQDFSCLVSGLTLACIVPVNMPWYYAVVCAVLTVSVKYLFGGLGNNIFNPSALARSVLGCMAAGMSFDFFTDGSSQTVLQTILNSGAESVSIKGAFLGEYAGAIGTTAIILILISAIVFMIFKVIRWENLLFSLVGFITITVLTRGASYILPMLLSGSFLFVTVFMLNDTVTSPYGFSARCFYAAIFGILAALFMTNNVLGESAVFLALLIANFLAPALDTVFSLTKKGVKNND